MLCNVNMPSLTPGAAFEPVSPDLDLDTLVKSTPNFDYAPRIHCDLLERNGHAAFDQLIRDQVVLRGRPLVITGYQQKLNQHVFSVPWLLQNCGSDRVEARSLNKQANVPMSLKQYLRNMSILTNRLTKDNYKDPQTQRLYLKDVDYPTVWHEHVARLVPSSLFYLNDGSVQDAVSGS